MSFLARSSRPLFSASTRAAALRPFTTGQVRLLKETAGDEPDLGSKFEQHKQDQLQKQKEGKGHWKPELASNSEESVAADRNENNSSIKEMQDKTVKHVEEKQK